MWRFGATGRLLHRHMHCKLLAIVLVLVYCVSPITLLKVTIRFNESVLLFFLSVCMVSLLQFFLVCAFVVSYVTFVLSSRISLFFYFWYLGVGAGRGLCFVIVVFPGYLYLYFTGSTSTYKALSSGDSTISNVLLHKWNLRNTSDS